MISGLTPKEYSILQRIIIAPLKDQGCQVWVFGSRARGDHQKFSDIDILYSQPKNKFSPGFISNIIESIEESRLPYKVDLVLEDNLALSYRDGILRDRIEL